MPSDSARTAVDLGLAVLAGIVLLGAFGVAVDGAVGGALALGAAAVAAGLHTESQQDEAVLAAGVLLGYAGGLWLVGPELGWVYPAPFLPLMAGAAALFAVPLATIGVGLRSLAGRGSRRPGRVFGISSVVLAVGSGVYLLGLPRTLWLLPSWNLAVAAGSAAVVVSLAARRNTPTGADVATALRAVAAVTLLCLYVLVVGLLSALLVAGGAIGLVQILGQPDDSVVGYPIAVALTILGVEAATAASVPFVRFADSRRLVPEVDWPSYDHRRTMVTVAGITPIAVAAISVYPPVAPTWEQYLRYMALVTVTASGYAGLWYVVRGRLEPYR